MEMLYDKLKGKEIQFVEFRDGFIMRPVIEVVKSSRGFLRNKGFSTKEYFDMKQEEKRIER